MMIVLLFGLFLLDSETQGTLTRVQVPAPSLAGNITGEGTSRFVSIYTPPSYDRGEKRRYPVLYLLHGIGDTDQTWTNGPGETIVQVLNREMRKGSIREFIVVMPHQRTTFFGSFYTNSTVTGNWADFTTKDLVKYVDGHYRTFARAESRGIAGHSMGGYGALTLGMKHPHILSVVYGLNPALLGWGGDLTIDQPAFQQVPEFKDQAEMMAHMRRTGNIYTGGVVCVGQAFSPNPNKPPFYMDLPFVPKGGEMVRDREAHAKWEAHMPVYMAVKYKNNLLELRGYRFDSGYEDEYTHIPVTARAFSSVLTKLGVPHIFEEYNGDHRNRLYGPEGRLATEVLPYFSRLLAFE